MPNLSEQKSCPGSEEGEREDFCKRPWLLVGGPSCRDQTSNTGHWGWERFRQKGADHAQVFPQHSDWDQPQIPCVSDSVTPWTSACRAPLSMGFSRKEYWSGLPFPSPADQTICLLNWSWILYHWATWEALGENTPWIFSHFTQSWLPE